MIPTLLIDDEPNALASLRFSLSCLKPRVEIVGMAQRIEEGLHLIARKAPKLVFLDIFLMEGTGFDLLERLPTIDFDLVFVTASSVHSVDALKFSAIDYLHKPVDLHTLQKTLHRIHARTPGSLDRTLATFHHNQRVTAFSHRKLALPTRDGLEIVPMGRLLYFEGKGTYTRVHLQDGSCFETLRLLRDLEGLLKSRGFFRITREVLLNLRQVTSVRSQGTASVTLANGAVLFVHPKRVGGVLEGVQEFV